MIWDDIEIKNIMQSIYSNADSDTIKLLREYGVTEDGCDLDNENLGFVESELKYKAKDRLKLELQIIDDFITSSKNINDINEIRTACGKLVQDYKNAKFIGLVDKMDIVKDNVKSHIRYISSSFGKLYSTFGANGDEQYTEKYRDYTYLNIIYRLYLDPYKNVEDNVHFSRDQIAYLRVKNKIKWEVIDIANNMDKYLNKTAIVPIGFTANASMTLRAYKAGLHTDPNITVFSEDNLSYMGCLNVIQDLINKLESVSLLEKEQVNIMEKKRAKRKAEELERQRAEKEAERQRQEEEKEARIRELLKTQEDLRREAEERLKAKAQRQAEASRKKLEAKRKELEEMDKEVKIYRAKHLEEMQKILDETPVINDGSSIDDLITWVKNLPKIRKELMQLGDYKKHIENNGAPYNEETQLYKEYRNKNQVTNADKKSIMALKDLNEVQKKLGNFDYVRDRAAYIKQMQKLFGFNKLVTANYMLTSYGHNTVCIDKDKTTADAYYIGIFGQGIKPTVFKTRTNRFTYNTECTCIISNLSKNKDNKLVIKMTTLSKEGIKELNILTKTNYAAGKKYSVTVLDKMKSYEHRRTYMIVKLDCDVYRLAFDFFGNLDKINKLPVPSNARNIKAESKITPKNEFITMITYIDSSFVKRNIFDKVGCNENG